MIDELKVGSPELVSPYPWSLMGSPLLQRTPAKWKCVFSKITELQSGFQHFIWLFSKCRMKQQIKIVWMNHSPTIKRQTDSESTNQHLDIPTVGFLRPVVSPVCLFILLKTFSVLTCKSWQCHFLVLCCSPSLVFVNFATSLMVFVIYLYL